ncbi:MAG: hypothetical protein EOM50_19730, partial [Erysipelotrichia bacterium]|nr:hypothetical protein [Erysipelotrichia bacterium]
MENIINWILKNIYSIDINSLLLQNKRLVKENTQYSSKNEILERENYDFSETVSNLKNEINILKNRNTKLIKETNDNREIGIKLQATVDTLNYNLVLENENTRVLKSQIDKATAIIKEKESEIKKILAKVQQLELIDKGVCMATDNDQVKDQIENLNRQYQNLKELYNRVCKDNTECKAKVNTKDGTIDILNKELIELRNENIRLRKNIDSVLIVEKNSNSEVFEVADNSDNPILNGVDSVEDKHFIEKQKEGPKFIEVKSGTIAVSLESMQNMSASSYVDETKRTIDTIVDLETGSEIKADIFFSQPENLIFKARTELEKAIYLKKTKCVCKYCGQMIKISGRKTERGMARFFSHLRDSNDCDYKTTTGETKKEIDRGKYAKCNEGERHKRLKDEIAFFLKRTSVVLDVKTENTIIGNHPITRWKRPDVSANFMGQEIIFELQLSTTFISVITERDLFYRL